jgi:ribosome-binding protein aMBF1 (putative translation factor)
MHCRICGDTDMGNLQYRERSRMTLCDSCHADTPAKVGREEFEREYWGDGIADVPHGTRQSFWEDYRASKHGKVADYLAATTSHYW